MNDFYDSLLRYKEDVFSIVSRWVFWILPLVSLITIFLGKSFRFYGAFLSLLFLIIMGYVCLKQLKSKKRLFGIYSLALCWLFFTGAGTLVGLALKASGVIFFVFLVISLFIALHALIFSPYFISFFGGFIFLVVCIFIFVKIINYFKVEDEVSLAYQLLYFS